MAAAAAADAVLLKEPCVYLWVEIRCHLSHGIAQHVLS